MAYTPINWAESTNVTATKLNQMDNQIDTNDSRITTNENDILNLQSLKNIQTATGSFSGQSTQQEIINISNAYILQIKLYLHIDARRGEEDADVFLNVTNTPLISSGEVLKSPSLNSIGTSESQNFYYNDIYFTNGDLTVDYSTRGNVHSANGSYEIKYIEF